MLIPKKTDKTNVKKPITFRISSELSKEFKELCKELKITQSSIIENAIKLAIKEMKEIKNEK